MGVPRFFRALYKLLSNRIGTTEIKEKINALLFDLPSLLHSVAQSVYAYGDEATDEDRERIRQLSADKLKEEFYAKLTAEIRAAITEADPRVVGLFMDGVPVGGKIQQQRQRRFMAAQNRKPDAVFDSNNITAGTSFLREVSEHLTNWITQIRAELPQIVIFSSPYSPGEGEHKMMDLIRSGDPNLISDELGPTVIYGLDTDLFMLSLLLPIEKVYLWRPQAMGDYPDYLDVLAAKRRLLPRLSGENMEDLEEKKQRRLMRDFVVFTFLLGNDFLPRTQSMENFDVILEQLVDMYSEFQQKESRPLTKSGQIIWRNTLQFIKVVASHEGEFIVANTEIKTFQPGVAYKAALKRKGGEYILDYPTYRNVYYDHRHQMESEYTGLSMRREEYPVEMVHDYLTTMNFLFDYYLFGSSAVSKHYYYRFHYPPLLSDLVNLGAKIITDIVNDEQWRPSAEDTFLHPLHLLVAVLPRKSFNIMLKIVREQVEAKILEDKTWSSLYPRERIVIDLDGVLSDHYAPVLVPYFPLSLVGKINLPAKSLDNLDVSWVVDEKEPEKKKKKRTVKKEEKLLF